MTQVPDDDPIAAALASLRTHDLGPTGADRVRRRCHRLLRRSRAERPAGETRSGAWTGQLGPALLVTWGAIYLIEALRMAVSVL